MQTQDQPQHAPAAQAERPEHVDVLVIGAGQAGLAVGWHLREQGITSFLLLDAGPEVGHVWRNRWDSLRLFTPAEYDALPGMPFPAPAGTYPTKDEVADYLRGYAAAFELPVRLNTRVTRLTKTGDTFHADTSTGPITARQVVIATGPFQTPVVPTLARHLAADVVQLHSADYRNPDQLPDGPVLVVGAGNSGLQIAAELAATRPVTVAVGTRPPMLPQRLLGRDLFWWLTRLGLITKTADSRLARRLQKKGDLVIGTRWRDLARLGIQVRPRLDDVDLTTAMFADGSVTRWPPSCGPPGSAPTTRGSTSPAPSWTTRSRTSAASPPSPASASWACRGCTPAAPPCSGTSRTTPPGSPTTSATTSRPRAPRLPQATCSSEDQSARRRCPVPALPQVELGELAAGGDPGLGEDVPQVERDGARRHPALGGDVLVRQALADQAGDLAFHRCQRQLGGRVALAGGLPGRAQLLAGAGGERLGAQVLERLERGAQVGAGVDAVLGAAQELAVREVGAGPVVRAAAPVGSGVGVMGQGGSRTGLVRRAGSASRARPWSTAASAHGQPGALGERGELLDPRCGLLVVAGADGGVDAVDARSGG